MLQVSMDGPAVNWAFFDALMNYRSEWELPQMINIGSCSIHTVHGALKIALESTSWRIKQTLKGIWQKLHESPARRENFESVTGTNKHPLFFCSTRWVSSICKLVEFWEKLPPSKRPQSKSFLNVQEAVKDSLKLLKLDFYSFIASLMEPYLCGSD